MEEGLPLAATARSSQDMKPCTAGEGPWLQHSCMGQTQPALSFSSQEVKPSLPVLFLKTSATFWGISLTSGIQQKLQEL